MCATREAECEGEGEGEGDDEGEWDGGGNAANAAPHSLPPGGRIVLLYYVVHSSWGTDTYQPCSAGVCNIYAHYPPSYFALGRSRPARVCYTRACVLQAV